MGDLKVANVVHRQLQLDVACRRGMLMSIQPVATIFWVESRVCWTNAALGNIEGSPKWPVQSSIAWPHVWHTAFFLETPCR